MDRLDKLFIAAGIATLVAIILLSMGQLVTAADAETSGPSFGPLFFAAGLFLIIFSPIMGFLSINSGNVFAAIMWWMLGTTLGAGLLFARVV